MRETWNEVSEHGYRHEGSTTVAPTATQVFDRMIVGIRAAFWLCWEPRSLSDFIDDMDFGEAV